MLIGRFLPVEGGAEVQCRRLSFELKRKNHSVFVLTQSLRKSPATEEVEGLPVYRVGLPWNGKIGSLSYTVSGLFWLLKHRNSFDLLHVHMASAPAVLAVIAGKMLRKPVIMKIAGSRATGDIRTSSATWYGRIKLRFLLQHVQQVVCPSNEIVRELSSANGKGLEAAVIPNGIETEHFKPATAANKVQRRKEIMLPAAARIVLYCGRLQAGKGLDFLLSTWAETTQAPERKNWLLVIVGDGPLAGRLENDYGRRESVRFTGWKRETLPYLQAADMFVLPSLGEGMSNALIEAMSCGLPCIATRIGGTTDMIRHDENGLLYDPGDRQALAAYFDRILSDTEKAAGLGMKAREYVTKNLSIEKIAGIYEKVYERTCERYGKCITGKNS